MRTHVIPSLACLALVLLAGCTTAPTAREKSARRNLARVGDALRPDHRKPPLPVLRADSPPADFVRFAVLNHPAVEAAYHDWRAAVIEIVRARSLPDPQFTFEADVADTIMTFMPGVMFDLMEPAKRERMADEAAAKSAVAYRAFVTAVLRVAADARKAWLDFTYAEETQRVYLSAIHNLEQSLAFASNEFATARNGAGFDEIVRLQNQVAEHHAHHFSFVDRAVAARAKLKSALGLTASDADPPWLESKLVATTLPAEEELWRRVETGNASLAAMRAMVDMALAEIGVAQKAGTPDVALGVMADLKASPLMVRPTATVSLPIWREKIRAGIAAAEARRDGAQARVQAEQLSLAAEFAQMLYMVRESDRMIANIDETSLPNLRRALASAEVGYQTGMGRPTMMTELQHMALLMQLERVKVLYEREAAVIDLELLSAEVAPRDLPLLANAGLPP